LCEVNVEIGDAWRPVGGSIDARAVRRKQEAAAGEVLVDRAAGLGGDGDPEA
jgi:hypothetical protein